MAKLYIVKGFTGSFPDYDVWIVAAYRSKKNAQLHALYAKNWYNKHCRTDPDYCYKERKTKNPFDKNMQIYPGTPEIMQRWEVEEIEILAKLPNKGSK